MEMCMRRNAKRALGVAVALHLMLPACVVWANENAGGGYTDSNRIGKRRS